MMPKITVQKLRPEAVLPSYQSAGAAGADLSAIIDAPDGVIGILPGDRMIIDTGLAIGLPQGYEAQIRSRSGLAAKNGVFVLNSPGTIDSDYRGEIKVILFNTSRENFVIRTGDRIAQMVIAPVVQADFAPGDIEDNTARGAGGFGSTGVSTKPGASS